jgi:tetratricopeptide (TPR) repeat protein
MAQKGAENEPKKKLSSSVDVDELSEDVEIEFDQPQSVDKLLAITGENWDIAAQVKSLQEAAGEPSRPSGQFKAPSVAIPTPYDIAPTKGAPKPPPLPPEARGGSKSPPSPPVEAKSEPKSEAKSESKGPPPLPGSTSSSSAGPSGGSFGSAPSIEVVTTIETKIEARPDIKGDAKSELPKLEGKEPKSLPPPPLPNRGSKAPPPLPPTSTSPASSTSAGPPPLPGSMRPSKGPPPLPASVRPSTDAWGSIEIPKPPALPSTSPPPLAPPAARTTVQVDRQAIPAERPSRVPPPLPRGAQSEDVAHLVELLTARIALLEEGDDRIGLTRAHIEASIVAETFGDDGRATAQAEAALRVNPDHAVAHGILRRRVHGRASLGVMLAHLDHELEASTSDAKSAELYVERARLLDAMGDDPAQIRSAWEHALARSPHHAAALKGLEADLVARASEGGDEAWLALADHLARMADAYLAQRDLAAWLLVERAFILDFRIGQLDEAKGSLERALRLDPGTGPVRDAWTSFLAARGDFALLAASLDEEARLESDPARAARLELDAAVIYFNKLADESRAINLLERATARAPTVRAVDRIILDHLIRLHEAQGHYGDAARARRARLAHISEPSTVAYELRVLASIGERLRDLDSAIGDLEQALSIDVENSVLLEELDRLLAERSKDEQRVALWLAEATRHEDGVKRAKALTRAATIAETRLHRREEAIRHLRSATVASPGDPEIIDALSRLMSPPPPDRIDREVRALVELYAQAAQTIRDPGRRIAYLEKTATIWEEVLGDARRAQRAYEDILEIEPDRRGAVLGLGRCAGRLGDDRALARALADEARLAEDGADVLSLRARAAQVLARADATRAMSMIDEILAQDSAHPAARALETRLHEEAGRWELVAQSIEARIENAPNDKERFSLWLTLAHVQAARLRDPAKAAASLRSAHQIDPAHPVPTDETAKMLESAGDHQTLAHAYVALAEDTIIAEERGYWLVRAAELCELRLGDDEQAEKLYARALREGEATALAFERYARLLSRRAAATMKRAEGGTQITSDGFDERIRLFSTHIEKTEANGATVAARIKLDLVLMMSLLGKDVQKASELAEDLCERNHRFVGATRVLESLERKTVAWAPLARALGRQADNLTDVRARLGVLWNIAALEEWKLPGSDPSATYARVLSLDPTDPGALEATVRRELVATRKGEPKARGIAIDALRSLTALAGDEESTLAVELRLALLLEAQERDVRETALAREALERYRLALQIDPMSLTAATGLARLANRLMDVSGAVAAAASLSELSQDEVARARYLLDAAELLLGPTEDERLGGNYDRATRAAQLLERALDSDPNLVPAVERLATVRLERHEGERLIETFRSALARADHNDAIVLLGNEIARVSRDDLGDLVTGIEALRRVRDVVPDHVPSLLTMAELCIAQRAWPESVEVLEDIVVRAREASPKLTALFALASIYDKVLGMPDDSEKALRKALEIDPKSARGIRALVHRLVQKSNVEAAQGEGMVSEQARLAMRLEIASLLERLSAVETAPDARADILLELAEIRLQVKDTQAAEKALIDAVACAPSHPKAFARLARLFRTGASADSAGHARALQGVIMKAREYKTEDARWFSTLGALEVGPLTRTRDGIEHLKRAILIQPSLHESRYLLAQSYSRLGAHEDVVKTVLAMMFPSSEPLRALADPAGGLDLLERSLSAERRQEEAIVISELRAIFGSLDDGRHEWLRGRRLGPFDAHHAVLDRSTLLAHVLREEGKHPMFEVAGAIAGFELRALRSDLNELGLTPRDRIGKRSGHPTRALLDRMMKALGLSDIELVISERAKRTRVLVQDDLWLVLPKSVAELPEPTQLAAIARALSRIALAVPWLEELPPPHMAALLVAAARLVAPLYGQDSDVSQKLVSQYEGAVQREVTRKQRQALEKLAPALTAKDSRPLTGDALLSILAKAELRAAYLLTGDLLATIDELRALDNALMTATETPGRAALGAVLDHPFAGDVAHFALGAEATALRRRVGSTWTS